MAVRVWAVGRVFGGRDGVEATMDHSRVPVLVVLQEFRRRGDTVYGPPGHRQGRGVDPRVAEIVGIDVGPTCSR